MTGSLLAITPVDAPGGAETTLLRLLAGLRDRGWQIALTTPGRGPLREQALAAGFRWHALPLGGLAPRSGTRALRSWPLARRLSRWPQVVYLNGGVCGRVLPALGRPARIVLHIHDMVRRVPRFWRRADVVLAASQAVADRLGGLEPHVVTRPPTPTHRAWPRRGQTRAGRSSVSSDAWSHVRARSTSSARRRRSAVKSRGPGS